MANEVDLGSHNDCIRIEPPNPLGAWESFEGINDCWKFGPNLGDIRISFAGSEGLWGHTACAPPKPYLVMLRKWKLYPCSSAYSLLFSSALSNKCGIWLLCPCPSLAINITTWSGRGPSSRYTMSSGTSKVLKSSGNRSLWIPSSGVGRVGSSLYAEKS